MISDEDRKQLDVLQAQTHCAKHFSCVYDALDRLCEGKYHPELDIMECLDKTLTQCQFSRAFGCTFVCTCPVRKFIAQNFDKWTADTTSQLRARPSNP